MTKENIDLYLKWMPAGSLLLVLLSSLKHIIYYSQFDINITNYIGVTEYISLFVDDAIIYLLPLLVLYLFLILFRDNLSKWREKKFEKMSDKKKEETINNNTEIKTRKYVYLFGILIFTFLMSRNFYLLGFFGTTIVENRSYIVLLLFSLYFYFFNHSIKYDVLALILINAFSSLFFGAFVESNNIKNGIEEFAYTVNFADIKQISTDSNIKFVGKTKDFVFFYNLEKQQSDAISTRSLISVKKTRKIVNYIRREPN